jgi:hypothetical protein
MDEGELDRALISRMLLEHERRLRRIDDELREVRRRIEVMGELRGEALLPAEDDEERRISRWSGGLESMR